MTGPMTGPVAPPPTARSRRGGPWPFLLALLALVAMLCATLLYVFHSISRVPESALEHGRAALRGLERVAEAFREGTVTTSFASYATEIEGVTRLQIASLRQVEVFERTDEASVFWGVVDLPDLVVSARAPVETTYYLDLEAPWQFVREGRHIRVTAPPIRFNRPAVDVSAIHYEVLQGSLLRDERDALQRLQKGITAMSTVRARQNIPLVRETARARTEQFVGTWLAWQFEDGAEHQVEVSFREELQPAPREPGDVGPRALSGDAPGAGRDRDSS